MKLLTVITRGLVVAALVLASCTSDAGPETPENAPVEVEAGADLAASAEDFAARSAVIYSGYYTDSDGERVELVIRTTNSGESIGTLVSRDAPARVLAVGNNSFVRGGRPFWTAQGVSDPNHLAAFSNRWVKLRPADLGIDISELAPATLGARFSESAGESATGTPDEIDGTPVTRIRVDDWTVYVTTAEPHEVVRVESGTGGQTSSTGEFQLASLAAGGLQLNVGDVSNRGVDRVYSDLTRGVRQLNQAADSGVDFSVTAGGNLTGCNVGQCVVNVQVSNQIAATDDVKPGPITAVMTVDLTVDGRAAGNCTDEKSLPPNGTTTMSCSIPAPPWARDRNRPHTANAAATVRARAVSTVAIRRLLKDLNTQREQAVCAREGNSFVLGTGVVMAGGRVEPIRGVRAGDAVWAARAGRQRAQSRLVAAVIHGAGEKRLVSITFRARPSGSTGTVTATDEHRFWVADQAAWVEAKRLNPGDRLVTSGGRSARILRVREFSDRRQVRNLSVRGLHSFFVGSKSANVLVHNQNPPCPITNFDAGAFARPDFTRDVARGSRPDTRKKAHRYLALNMIALGLKRPPDTAAHHIVAWGAGRAAQSPEYLKVAIAARRVLDRYGIDLNSAANGVFLRTSDHRSLHTANYYQTVTERLRDARSKEDVVDILNDLREQLIRAPGSLR